MKPEDIIKATRNSLNIYSFTAEALEKLIAAIQSEHKCPTCEALARTVMMDQTAHDTHTAAQRQWTGLTDDDIEQEFGFIDELLRDCVYRTEAKLKEKNG
jgi:predicted secreted Zn-dependent protease